MRVVFDTNVLISATLWDNSVAQKLLSRFMENGIEICVSLEIIIVCVITNWNIIVTHTICRMHNYVLISYAFYYNEYKNVLIRDFHYSNVEVNHVIQKILSFVSIIVSNERIDVIKEDPSDNRILECAISSGATYILSYDKHLLDMNEYRGIRIITPNEF